jgi:hypothetical protein
LLEAPVTPCDAPSTCTRKGSPNGLTHGLHSQEAVIDGEDPAAFEAYREDLLTELQPVGIREGDLVETMVMAQWKLRRLWRGETRVCGRSQAAQIFNDFYGPRQYAALTSHEAHLLRAYLRAEARLRLLQDLRRKGLGDGVEAGHAARARTIAGACAIGLPEAPATPCDASTANAQEPPPMPMGSAAAVPARARSRAPLPIHASGANSRNSADGVGARCCAPAVRASALESTACADMGIGEITNRLSMSEAGRFGNAGDVDLLMPVAPGGRGADCRADETLGQGVSFSTVGSASPPPTG